MRFEWDERKRLSNLEKHGLDFVDVVGVFEAPHVVVPSAFAGGEERFPAIGILEGRSQCDGRLHLPKRGSRDHLLSEGPS